MTNHGMTIEEALYVHGVDINEREDLIKAYEAGEPYVCCEDDYFIDFDGLDLVY